MTIKIRISELLGIHKMSQKELADKTGIRAATISALFHEQIKRIDIDHIDSLCKVFKCEPGDIFKFTDVNENSIVNNSHSISNPNLHSSNMELVNSKNGMMIKKNIKTDMNDDENKNPYYNITREYIEEIIFDILKEKKDKK